MRLAAGLPAAYLLAIKAGWELKGLWAGLVLCTSVQGVVMLVVLYRFNWNKEAARAVALVAANGSSSSLAHGGADDAALARTEDSAAKLHLDKEGGSDSPSIPALHSGSGSSSTAAGREQ